MPHPSTSAPPPRRADARRNRERLLDATAALILEVGGEPTRDTIAERAGVGIGTLYRHFPDRQPLLHAVVRHVLERTLSAGEAALEGTEDGLEALRRYMHAAVDQRIGVVNLVYPLLDAPHPDLRARAEALIHALITRGLRQGRLRSDITPADVVFATLRFSRPFAVQVPSTDERAIAHRQIDIYVDGLGKTSTDGR